MNRTELNTEIAAALAKGGKGNTQEQGTQGSRATGADAPGGGAGRKRHLTEVEYAAGLWHDTELGRGNPVDDDEVWEPGRGRWENVDSDMAGFAALCSSFACSSALHTVALADCGLGDSAAAQLATAVKGGTITSIDWSHNSITSDPIGGWTELCDAIAQSSVATAKFTNCDLGAETLIPLTQAMRGSLAHLCISERQ